MSGLTAYEARRRAGDTAVETGGELWGHTRVLPTGERLHYIELATVSVFAKRTPSSIADYAEEYRVKRAFMGKMRPELCLLGDFHTHPYDNLTKVKQEEGWRSSPNDRDFWRGADEHWASSANHPVFLVLALCPIQRVRGSEESVFYNNIRRFDVANYRFWLNAVVGKIMKSGKRGVTRSTNSSVVLDPLPLNLATLRGERLHDADPIQQG